MGDGAIVGFARNEKKAHGHGRTRDVSTDLNGEGGVQGCRRTPFASGENRLCACMVKAGALVLPFSWLVVGVWLALSRAR